jgi:hypothetical protein
MYLLVSEQYRKKYLYFKLRHTSIKKYGWALKNIVRKMHLLSVKSNYS